MFDFLPGIIILAVVVLVLVHQLIRWTIDSRIPAQLYLKYIYPRRTTAALEKGDARQAERQVYRAYLERLLDPDPTAREIAIQYLAHLTASHDLTERLIEALRLPQRSEVQEQLARLLRDALHDLSKSSSTTHARLNHAPPAWRWALTIWITEAILMAISWFWLPQVSLEQFVLLGVVVAVITFLPLTWLVREKRWLVQFASLSTGIVLAALSSFSNMAHAGTGLTPLVSLDAYGFENVTMQIAYPRWLTADDVDSCTTRAEKVTIMAYGADRPKPDPLEISFKSDLSTLNIVDKDCLPVESRFVIGTFNSAGEPVNFFLKPANREVLARQKITMTPIVRNLDPNTDPTAFPVGELAFAVWLEDPIWKTIRDIAMIGAGVATLPAFVAFLLARRPK